MLIFGTDALKWETVRKTVTCITSPEVRTKIQNQHPTVRRTVENKTILKHTSPEVSSASDQGDGCGTWGVRGRLPPLARSTCPRWRRILQARRPIETSDHQDRGLSTASRAGPDPEGPLQNHWWTTGRGGAAPGRYPPSCNWASARPGRQRSRPPGPEAWTGGRPQGRALYGPVSPGPAGSAG